MNSLRNRLQLVGNLGTNPEVRKSEKGQNFTRFTLATTEVYKDKEGKYVKNTQWYNVIMFDNLSNYAGKYTQKGDLVAVEGLLIHKNYETKEGEKRLVAEIIANDMLILKSKKEEEIIF